MSESANTPSTTAAAPTSCGCTASTGSNAPKQSQPQAAAAATTTPPPAQKGFKRQGRKQH